MKRKLKIILIHIVTKLGFLLPDRLYLKLQFRLRMGYRLRLDKPQTLSEKIQWLKIYDRNPLYTNMVDKYEVKFIVAELIGIEHVIQTLGVWNSVEDIDWKCLPKQFVLKTTHGGGSNGVMICSDKNKLDKQIIINNFQKAFKQNIFNDFREWPYKNVRRRIIVEQFMSQGANSSLIDYKFFCFNGTPKYVYVSQSSIDGRRHLSCFLTIDWQLAPFRKQYDEYVSQPPKKPVTFEQMCDFATKLSHDIPFVRVDLYEINEKVYFSEMTFYPSSGMQPFEPNEWDYKLGEMLNLSEIHV